MRRTFIPLALVVWLAGAFATAELSQSFKDWPATPAGFLLTQSERKAYAELKTDVEAQAFIDLFWAKRDPDLNTVANEFKLDFEQRVAAADKMFSTEKRKGSLSDRGKVLIIMGRPTSSVFVAKKDTVRGPNAASGAFGAVGGDSAPAPAPWERAEEDHGDAYVWFYKRGQLPPSMKADEVKFFFVESARDAKDFSLNRSKTSEGLANKALAEQVEFLVRNPKIKEVPRPGLISGSKAATSAQAAVLDLQPRPWPAGAVMHVISGVKSPVLFPIWVHVELPDSAPVAAQAVGRVREAESGKEIGTFVVPAAPLSLPGARGYEFALPVNPGKLKVEIALLADSGPVAIGSGDVTIEAAPAEGTFFSPFYTGVDIRQEPRLIGDAFNVGGWRVVPHVSNKYLPSESLSYFCYIVRPGLDTQQKPAFQLGMKLFVNDKPAGELPPAAVEISQVGADLWMFGNAAPLTNFAKPGDYRLEITLIDTVSKAQSTGKLNFTMGTPAGGAAAPTGK